VLRSARCFVPLVLTCALLTACAGSGELIADNRPCSVWLDGNGRDRYLQAHGLADYDAEDTGRRPETALIARIMHDVCSADRKLAISEALRQAQSQVLPPGAPARPARPSRTTERSTTGVPAGARRRSDRGE